jgi:hypothetical protein
MLLKLLGNNAELGSEYPGKGEGNGGGIAQPSINSSLTLKE